MRVGKILAVAAAGLASIIPALAHGGRRGNLMISPLGHAQVVNRCQFPVYSNIVHGPRPGADGPPEEIPDIIGPGESRRHSFSHDPNIGVSWKIIRELEHGLLSGPVQMEYTWVPEQMRVYWDLSMIDAGSSTKIPLIKKCDTPNTTPSENATDIPIITDDSQDGIYHPFADVGMSLVPILAANVTGYVGNCGTITCDAGRKVCESAYNFPEDWEQQKDCIEEMGLRLNLCG